MSTAFTLRINQIKVLQKKKRSLCDNEGGTLKKYITNSMRTERHLYYTNKFLTIPSIQNWENLFFRKQVEKKRGIEIWTIQFWPRNYIPKLLSSWSFLLLSLVVATVFIYWQIICVSEITFTQNQWKIAAKSKITVERERKSFGYVNSWSGNLF